MTKARENSDYTGLQGDLALKSPVASPVLTGNVGIGATPANNATPASGLQVGATASIGAWESGSNIITTIGSNSYFNSTYKYITTNTAALIRLINGAINFNVAPSGSANAAISWTTAMNINAAGIVTKPLQPAFRACKDTGDTSSTGYIVWNASKINVGGHYSTSTGKFTAPVAGNYYFAVRALTASATQNNIWIGINHNGNSVLQTYHSHINHSNISGEAVITMAANDYVQTYWGGTGSIHTGGTNHHIYSFFQGHLIG